MGLRRGGRCSRGVADIDGELQDFSAQLFPGFRQLGLVPIPDRQLGAPLRQASGDSETDTLGAAGDDGDPAAEIDLFMIPSIDFSQFSALRR